MLTNEDNLHIAQDVSELPGLPIGPGAQFKFGAEFKFSAQFKFGAQFKVRTGLMRPVWSLSSRQRFLA